MTAREILALQLHNAIDTWQAGAYLSNNPNEAVPKAIDNNRQFAENIASAVDRYVTSLKLTILPRTIFGTAGGPVVYPWSTSNVMTADNHGYLKDADIIAQTTDEISVGGFASSKKVISTPTNRV